MSDSKPYVIEPNPTCPTYDNLRGWRAVLNKWFGVEFKRARCVFFAPGRRLICAPETVPIVKKWLDQRRIPCVVAPARPTIVPREESK